MQHEAVQDMEEAEVITGRVIELLYNEIQCGNQKAVMDLTELACTKQLMYAQAALAILLSSPEKIFLLPRDPPQAEILGQSCIKFLRKKSVGACRVAQCFYGLFLLYGIGTEEQLERSERMLKLSSEQGYSIAQCHLGLWLTDRDEPEAMRQFRLASDQGNAVAQYHLAKLIEQSEEGPYNFPVIFNLHLMSSARGHSGSLYFMGHCKRRGIGIAVDKSQAIRLFEQAAEQEHPEALNALGECYMNGEGTITCGSTAIVYFEKGVQVGSAEAWSI
jgi:TPR repeat protein